MIRAAACLLAAADKHAAAAVKKAKAKTRKIRQGRKRKSVWVRDWLLKRKRYGMFPGHVGRKHEPIATHMRRHCDTFTTLARRS